MAGEASPSLPPPQRPRLVGPWITGRPEGSAMEQVSFSRLQEDETGWNQENKSGWKWPSGTSWWSSVENLLSSPGDAGLIPGQGTKIPRASGQLSPCCVCNKRSPCTTIWESVRDTTKTQHSKNKERTSILSNVAFEISMEPWDSSSNILFPHFVCLMTYIIGLPPLLFSWPVLLFSPLHPCPPHIVYSGEVKYCFTFLQQLSR